MLTSAMLSPKNATSNHKHVGMLPFHQHTSQEACVCYDSTQTFTPSNMHAPPCSRKKLARQGETARTLSLLATQPHVD